jgi:hypothetical protein
MTRSHRHCRYCNCSDENPCRLENGEDCTVNEEDGVCNGRACLVLAGRDKDERIRAARPKRVSSADIHLLIKRGNRKPKKKVA